MIEVKNGRLVIKDLLVERKVILALSELSKIHEHYAESQHGVLAMEDAVNKIMVNNGFSHFVITIILSAGKVYPMWHDLQKNYFV